MFVSVCTGAHIHAHVCMSLRAAILSLQTFDNTDLWVNCSRIQFISTCLRILGSFTYSGPPPPPPPPPNGPGNVAGDTSTPYAAGYRPGHDYSTAGDPSPESFDFVGEDGERDSRRESNGGASSSSNSGRPFLSDITLLTRAEMVSQFP